MESLELAKTLVLEKYKDTHKSRLEHILGVAEMAEELSKRYHADVEKAKIAAYMHDYCKYDSKEEIEPLLTAQEIEECREYPFLYHAYGSAYMYRKYIGTDEDIFAAIYNHVFGRPGMSLLETIIMIADYTEKNRKYPSCIACREILLAGRLEEAVWYSLKQMIDFAVSEGNRPHPRQLAVYEEYKRKVGM